MPARRVTASASELVGFDGLSLSIERADERDPVALRELTGDSDCGAVLQGVKSSRETQSVASISVNIADARSVGKKNNQSNATP